MFSQAAGLYELDTKYRFRVIGCNAFDGLFQLLLGKKVREQAFLRIEDVKAGEVVKGKVYKHIGNEKG